LPKLGSFGSPTSTTVAAPSGFFGGSKLIQDGTLPARFYRDAGVVFSLLATGCAVAIALIWSRPALLLLFALVLAGGWAYSVGPFRLSYRRYGEACVLLLFGPAPVAGGVFAQTGALPSASVLLASLPFGLLTAAILVANEVPDTVDDAAAGKRTLVGWIGAERGYILFAALVAAAYAAVLLGVAVLALGSVALLSLAALPFALHAARVLKHHHGDKPALLAASRSVIALHAIMSLTLIGDALA